MEIQKESIFKNKEKFGLINENDACVNLNCDLPWFSMSFFHDQQVGCCCYYQGGFASWDFLRTSDIDIDTWWNSEQLQTLRKNLGAKLIKNTPCEACFYPKYVREGYPSYLSLPADLNEKQRVNWERAIGNFHDKKQALDSYPVRYCFQFGTACNLNCIMCCQKEIRITDNRQIPVDPLLAQKKYLMLANEFFIIGGEPFVIPAAKKFIDSIISDPDYANVRLTIVTNATLLHTYLDQLKTMKKVTITVSLDAIGQQYEYIRRGAKWNAVEKNILDFLQVSRDNNLDWNLTCNNLIMKSSIPSLVDLSKWCIEKNIHPLFSVLCTQEFTESEDVFRFPELLDAIPHWCENFNESIELFRSHGWNDAASQLTTMRDELLTRKRIQNSQETCGLISLLKTGAKLFVNRNK